MGKRKGRRAATAVAETLTDPVPAEPSCGGGCCAKSDGGETAASCSSGEEADGCEKEDVDCCASEKETNGCEKEAAGDSGGCCSSKTKEVKAGCCSVKDSQASGDSDCCSSKAATDDGCCSKNAEKGGCCSSKEPLPPTDSGCCSSKAKAAIEDDCCSSKTVTSSAEDGALETTEALVGDDCCSSKAAQVLAKDGCCSAKKKAEKSGCCSSKATETAIEDDCCSLKAVTASTENDCGALKATETSADDGCCLSKKEPKQAGCCSSKSDKAPTEDGCCSSKKEKAPTEDDCCSSNASSKREGDVSDGCASKKAPKASGCCSSNASNARSDGCCSSKAKDLALPERSPSFLKRLVQFRSDRGASLEKQRPTRDRSCKKKQSADSLEFLRLNISGMTCSGCCTRIEKFMITQRGVTDVNVSLLTSRGVFQFDPQLVTAKHIEDTVATLGFEPSVLSSDDLVSVVLHLGQSESTARAKKLLLQIPGVVSAEHIDAPAGTADALSKVLLVEYNPDTTGARRIVRQLSRELGCTVQASSPQTPAARAGEEEVRRFTRLLFWSCLLSLPVIFVEFLLPLLFPSSDGNPADTAVWGTANRLSIRDAVELACATPVLFIVARPIHESAFLALRYGGRVTMDVLISLSACTAYAFSVFTVVTEAFAKSHAPEDLPAQVDPITGLTLPSPHEQVETPAKSETFFQVTVLLITLILVGRYIETVVKARASNSVDALLRMQAKTAILLEEDQKELYIDIVLVERGDLLKVLPGTRVPTDGVVVGGASSVDESMVTGEARKVPKEPGAAVIGGSINSQGVLTMRVTHTIHESMLARMVRLVGEAQASRGVRQSIADAVAAYFTTFIIILAGIMFMVWYSLAKHGHVDTQGWAPFPFALRFAITVLVISCPCAISLAVPTAVMVATTKGSQVGVLFKGGRALEALEDVDAVVFDKTGTLTSAQLGVAAVFTPRDGIHEEMLWRYVAAAESGSEHAIGKALAAHAERQLKGSFVEEAQGFEAVPGCGVHCSVQGADVRLGSLTWLKQQTCGDSGSLTITADFSEANQRFQSQGCIVVFVAIDGALLSAIALRDAPRPEAKHVIDQLKRDGIQPWIVTGDQRGTAMSVAAALGVPEGSVIAESLPHQKVDKVRLLQSLGLRVAFVGDGVNDAPALATADVGVALGAGTDVAIDAADVVLVKDDLRDLLNARALSCATNRRIKHNFAWGFMYNVLLMPIACGALYAPLGIWIPPALAGLSELLSSVPVILFSLLLNLWKPPFRGDWGLQEHHVAIDVSESTPLLRKSH